MHDSLYLKENQYKNPKEYFKFALKLIKEHKSKKINLIDIGCAAGDFLFFINEKLGVDNYQLYGIDVSDQLVSASQLKLKGATIKKYDFGLKNNDLYKLFNIKFELITMFGVHSCFDNLDWLENLSKSLALNGEALIFGIFNPYPYDVLMRVKKSDSTEYESGWNVHSIESLKNKSKKLNLKLEIINYQPNISISKNQSDFLRAWTIDINQEQNPYENSVNSNRLVFENERQRIFTNATRIIHDYCFCRFKKISED